MFSYYRDIENYAQMFTCGVLTEYARQGIGSKLMEKSIEVLRGHNYQLLAGIFSSFYSQKIAKKFGFKEILVIPYEGNYFIYEEFTDAMKQVHITYSVMAKRIDIPTLK